MKTLLLVSLVLLVTIFENMANASCDVPDKITAADFNRLLNDNCLNSDIVQKTGTAKISEAAETFLVTLGRDYLARPERLTPELRSRIAGALGTYSALAQHGCKVKDQRLCSVAVSVNDAVARVSPQPATVIEVSLEEAQDRACELKDALVWSKQRLAQEAKAIQESGAHSAFDYASYSRAVSTQSRQFDKYQSVVIKKTGKPVVCN